MEKLSMGEYTLAVWASYLVALAVLAACAWLSVRGLRRAQAMLKGLSE